jgi:hypothetical protein
MERYARRINLPESYFPNMIIPLRRSMDILNTAGGSEYRSRDFLKMIQLFLNKGSWNGEEIIPAEWLEKATIPKANT